MRSGPVMTRPVAPGGPDVGLVRRAEGEEVAPLGLGPCILLLVAEAPRHGYELIDRLKEFGFDWGGPGPIYHHLRKLGAAGLVRSRWEHPGGPARRVYELTDLGTATLAGYAVSASVSATRLECFLERARTWRCA